MSKLDSYLSVETRMCSLVRIAEAGLRSRARQDDLGQDEVHFLNPVKQIVETGRTPAEDMLEAFESRWEGRVEPLYRERSY